MRINREKLAVMLVRKDITATALATIAEVSRATLSAVSGGKSCSEETANKIAQALGIPVEDLIGE